MDFKIGEVFWDDDEPEAFGERLTFDDLKNVSIGERLLLDEDAENTPHGGTVVTLESLDDVSARFHGLNRMYVIGRRDMEEDCMEDDSGDFAMVWRIRNPDGPEKEETGMIQTGMRTPPADAGLAVTEQYTEAYNLNVKIHTSMQAIQQNLYDMCSALKKMRDGKLYKELGYQNFEDYCENGAGIGRQHAYKYIGIIEKLPADFVASMRQIGMTKLTLLTALTDDQREELTQTVDLESTTVRELKAQIAALQNQNEDAEKSRADAEKRAQEWYDKAQDMQEQIDELENRPVEVAVPEPSHELQNMQDAMRRINLEHEQWSAKIQDDHIKQVQEINRKHRAETDALRAEYEEKLAAAQTAPTEATEPDSKEVFKVYLAAVIDAAKRMMAFLSAHPDAACRAQAEKAFQTILQEVNNEQTV